MSGARVSQKRWHDILQNWTVETIAFTNSDGIAQFERARLRVSVINYLKKCYENAGGLLGGWYVSYYIEVDGKLYRADDGTYIDGMFTVKLDASISSRQNEK